MDPLPAETLEILEHLNTHSPLGPGSERLERDRCVIWIGDPTAFGLAEAIPQLTVVQRLRVPDGELPAVVEEVRALLRERGRPSATWEIGPTAQPADAGDHLLALCMVPDPEEPEIAGMAYTGPDPPMPPGIEVRRAMTPDERLAHRRVVADGFGMEAADEEELRRQAEQGNDGVTAPYVAYIDGEPVAAASSMLFNRTVVLNGASTRAAARGRGAFRALVGARIADARAQGVESAVVQAGAMSRPILERRGFERVLTIRVYLDRL